MSTIPFRSKTDTSQLIKVKGTGVPGESHSLSKKYWEPSHMPQTSFKAGSGERQRADSCYTVDHSAIGADP